MANTTRTLNPLHFEDLEPKRFEDLVRQLAYDFRDWVRLEATGRSGADEGFDARGYERLSRRPSQDESEAPDLEAEQETELQPDRLWLIQCKRERALPPAKLRKYLAELPNESVKGLHGIIFAAACDFSKASRDVLVEWARAHGLSEWHLWGKAELEDQLLQPKNDSLLFAYFGVSFVLQRRSKGVALRRNLAIKRRLKRFLDGKSDAVVLLRDLEDTTYPYPLEDRSAPRWRARRALQLGAPGLDLRLSMRPAWLSLDTTKWDAALGVPGVDLAYGNDLGRVMSPEDELLDEKANQLWRTLPKEEQAWLYVEAYLPYDRIELVDDIGDDRFEGPHLFVSGWDAGYPGFYPYIETVHEPKRRITIESVDDVGRQSIFPPETRDLRKVYRGL